MGSGIEFKNLWVIPIFFGTNISKWPKSELGPSVNQPSLYVQPNFLFFFSPGPESFFFLRGGEGLAMF